MNFKCHWRNIVIEWEQDSHFPGIEYLLWDIHV